MVVHKGAGMEGQMVGGWIKRFPAVLMGARRAARYTDRDKETKARPRRHTRRRGAERISRAQGDIVTSGWTTGAGGVQKHGERMTAPWSSVSFGQAVIADALWVIWRSTRIRRRSRPDPFWH